MKRPGMFVSSLMGVNQEETNIFADKVSFKVTKGEIKHNLMSA